MELGDVDRRVEVLWLDSSFEARSRIENETFRNHLPQYRAVGANVHDVGRHELTCVLPVDGDIPREDIRMIIAVVYLILCVAIVIRERSDVRPLWRHARAALSPPREVAAAGAASAEH